MTAARSLEMLIEGNERFAAGDTLPNRGDERIRKETLEGQSPSAVVLACSDSRVPPEIIFDRGIGDLFVVRVAGNIADDVVTGSIEYAASHLGVPLVVVLGHTGCGAITAVLSGECGEGHTGSIRKLLAPALEGLSPGDADAVETGARLNAVGTARALETSEPVLRPLVESGRLEIRAAMYDMASGRVEVLDR